jgi:hypothetical protein
MSISGVGQNYYQNNVATTKSTKNVNSAEKFTLEKTNGTQELSEAEEMELFKKEFYQELSQITMHTTVSNAAVNVTEAAFKRMKDDPEYKQQVLNWIKHDLGASYGSRNASVMLTVGGTLEECRGDAWPVSADSEFGIRSQDSFYKRSNEKKDKQKELLEEYLEKRAQAKRQQQEMLNEKAAKMEQERKRLTTAWNSERQMAKASNVYDANIMTEIVAGSDSLFG